MFLAIASTAFESTFLLPSNPQGETESTLPSVSLVEIAEVIALILAYIYPIKRPSRPSLALLKGALRAAHKYDMQPVLSGLRPHLLHQDFLRYDPIGVYGIASTLGFKEEARVVYESSLKLPLEDLFNCDGSSGDDLSGRSLSLLLKHRQEVSKEMYTVVYITFDSKDMWQEYGIPICQKCNDLFNWVTAWEQSVRRDVEQLPCTEQSFSNSYLAHFHWVAPGCPCDPMQVSPAWDAQDFLRLKTEVDKEFRDALEKVDWKMSAPF